MWCQNHKQCSKVMWPSPLSFLVNEMRASLSEDDSQVETGRTLRRSRNGSPFSDVDTASSEEARSVGAAAFLRSNLLLRTRRHSAQSSKVLKDLNADCFSSACRLEFWRGCVTERLPQGLFVFRAPSFQRRLIQSWC